MNICKGIFGLFLKRFQILKGLLLTNFQINEFIQCVIGDIFKRSIYRNA